MGEVDDKGEGRPSVINQTLLARKKIPVKPSTAPSLQDSSQDLYSVALSEVALSFSMRGFIEEERCEINRSVGLDIQLTLSMVFQ